MVQAISLHSFGLGGDSHVVYEDGDFRLGPRRVIPLSLLAHSHPDIIGDIARCTHAPLFLFKAPNAESRGRTRRELELLHRLTERPVERARLDLGPGAQAALETLLAREAVWASGLTPTDAQHVLGHQHSWSLPAAQAGFDVLAAITGRTSQECAQAIQARVVSESCRLLLEVALDGMDMPALVARAAAGGRHIGRVRFSMGLDLPLAGAGASAPLYYPEVARRLHTPLILHAHSDVTNAVGAAVGAVRGESAILISQPQPGLFRVHGPEITDFAVETEAFETAERLAEHAALAQAHRSGALRCHVKKHLEKKIYDKTRWIEAWVIAQATGRPEGTET
jgi:N-methylhydantoinase A/oxoprolinase/acetone carboxylase beta subunit